MLFRRRSYNICIGRGRLSLGFTRKCTDLAIYHRAVLINNVSNTERTPVQR